MIPHFVRQPVFGVPVDTAAITATRPLVLVFLRHAGSAHARALALAVNEIWPTLDEQDVGLVGVTEGALVDARDMVPRLHLLYPVIHDDGGLYDAFGVGRDRGLLRTLLRPSGLVHYPTVLKAGRGGLSGPLTRCAAVRIVARGGELAWSWDGRAITDLPDLDEVVRIALRG